MNKQLANAIRLACLAGSALTAPVMAQQAESTERANETSSTATTQQMSKIKVEDALIDDASSEGLGYASNATTLGKGVQTLREIPNSITVMTRDQLTDMNLTTIEGALKNVTGVTIQRFDATGSYTQFIARGYAADTYQLDGLNLQTDTNGVYFDLEAYDRVEVQRGAGAMFSGAGEPGVIVNMARKRAFADFHADTALSLSSWDDARLTADIGGALNDAGTLRGRAVAVVQEFDTYMDGIDDNSKYLAYGTLEQDIGDSTTIAAGVTWQAIDTTLSRGLPSWADGTLIDMPRSTMPVMDWNYQELDSLSAFAELENRGSDGALFKVALRYMDRTNDANFLDPSIPAVDGTMSALGASAFEREDEDKTADVYYSRPFEWAGQTHNVLIGADYRISDKFTNYAAYPSGVTGTVNLFDVDHQAIPEPDFAMGTTVSDTEVTSYGAYTQLRYRVASAWTLIGGGRVSWWKSDAVSNGRPTVYEVDSEFTPYGAVLFDVTESISLYTSYNQIFKPQNVRTISGDLVEPRIGEQIELGIKGEAVDGLLLYSAAAYRLIDKNRAMPDPTDPMFSIAAGKARSQGIETDVRGQITPHWSLSAGYAYTDTEYLDAPPAQQGQPVSTVTPKHAGNLWVHYTAGDWLPGLQLSAGMRAYSDYYNSNVEAPGYAVFALGGSYAINPRYTVAFNIDNLFDKDYWEKVSYPGRQNFFGEPRRFTVSLRVSM